MIEFIKCFDSFWAIYKHFQFSIFSNFSVKNVQPVDTSESNFTLGGSIHAPPHHY